MKKRKTSILLWSMMAVALSVLSSCIKSVDPPEPVPAKAYVSIMHLAPTAPSLDVFFNDTKVSSTPFAPGNVTVAYNAIDKGAFPITFKKASSDSIVASITFAQYDSLNFYTLFIYNQQANGPVGAVRIRDDFSKLTQNKTFYRFFHASPNTDAVDLYMDNVKIESGRVHADNTSSGLYNEFTGVSSGFHNLQVKLAGTDTVIANLDNADLLAGNAYTFYLRGLAGGSGSSQLSLGLLRAVN
ncbi:MAG TPA: DUF4397 domain-containing protein [Chitinophagaceae bacterium]|nr:DUF4397 domain-containing protein [Chitinophagaceae bacterium]